MKRAFLALGLIAGLAATPALAFQCPADIAAINAALETNTTLDAETRAQVEALRDKGHGEHEKGDHAASVATLAEAKVLLGLE